MSTLIRRLYDKKLLSCPSWIPDNIHYLTIMGSQAYHVSNGGSDTDVYGFVIPPKEDLFPHLRGEIMGFGVMKHGNDRFSSFQQHHIKDVDAEKEYDITLYNIVDYFQLCMECNPNMIDSLYTPIECVLHISKVGQMVREQRDRFLSKKAWHTFKGYAYAQLHKMSSKERVGKRVATIEEFGYDVKFAYHVYRLIDEVEQILERGTIDLTRGKEKMKAIRREKCLRKKSAICFLLKSWNWISYITIQVFLIPRV